MIEHGTPSIETKPLHEITQEQGEAGLIERLEHEISACDWGEETRRQVRSALQLALEAHSNDTRGDLPYSTHFLRVAIRIMSRNHLSIRDRPDLIIAALLHDTVEDHPEYYLSEPERTGNIESDRPHALGAISERFGPVVAAHVQDVTNPEFDPYISRGEKEELYREHVVELFQSGSDAAIIKLSDLIDNFVGIIHSDDPARARRMAHKYLPLTPHIEHYVRQSTLLAPHVKDRIIGQLARAEERSTALLQT